MKIAESSLKGSKTLGKGEIACYEQFLLFPQCFQKARFLWASKGVIVWEWVNIVNPSLNSDPYHDHLNADASIQWTLICNLGHLMLAFA